MDDGSGLEICHRVSQLITLCLKWSQWLGSQKLTLCVQYYLVPSVVIQSVSEMLALCWPQSEPKVLGRELWLKRNRGLYVVYRASLFQNWKNGTMNLSMSSGQG